MERPSEELRVLRFGPFEANFTTGELCKHGIRLKLQDQPFHVLKMLLARPGEMVTREEIRQALWPSGTFVDFDNGLNGAINRLREALGDSAEHPRFIETLPRRGYRFICPLDGPAPSAVQPLPPEVRVAGRKLWKVLVPSAVILVAAAIGGTFYFRSRQSATRLTEKDTIVLSDFDNKTNDPVFDGTLRQGLSVQLEQSPFLSLVSEQRIQQALSLMRQPAKTKLTPEISQELCQRTGGTAVIESSIAQIGTEYILILKAVNCSNGELLTSTEAQASDKSHVLDALGKTASEIRKKLGESLSTVQKLDRPLALATTSSLEALQAYSLGQKNMFEKGDFAAAVPLFQRAIRLDPQFALAYNSLGADYSQNGETSLGEENMRKAYELRDRVSERERLRIESLYYSLVIADLAKARQAYELWAQTYPRDFAPRANLGAIYSKLGEHGKALSEIREAWRLNPESALTYANLVASYLCLNRMEEARAIADDAQAKRLDSPFLHDMLYTVDFLQNDSAGMAKEVAWSTSRPGVEDVLLAGQANAAAYSGQLVKARQFSRLATASANRFGEKETAAGYEVEGALREGLFYNAAQALQHGEAALGLSNGRDVEYGAALAQVLAGDEATAQALAYDLSKRFPEDTVVQFNYLPTLRAQFALNRKDASKAIEALRAAAPYELGSPGTISFTPGLYPVYVRGEAYLAAHRGTEAATEFAKVIDHRGVVGSNPIGALAHLQLGRAYAMQGENPKARAAYQDFLTLWKDADPDIPILKQAKAEYAKLE